MISDRGTERDLPCVEEPDQRIYNGLYIVGVSFIVGLVVAFFIIVAIPIENADQRIARILRFCGWMIGAGILFTGYGLVLSVLWRRPLLPFPLGLLGRMNTLLFPLIRFLGRVLAIPSLRVEQSFLCMHNRMVRVYGKSAPPDRLLVLLPHCLERGVRKKLNQEIETYPCIVRVVGGGTQARAVVAEVEPPAILAVACERDLVSGVVELCGRIPMILAVPNIQSRGPCKSTDIHMDQFRNALRYFFPK